MGEGEFEPSLYRNPTDLIQMLMERSQSEYMRSYNIGGFPLDVFVLGTFADGTKTGYEYERCKIRANELVENGDSEKIRELYTFIDWVFDYVALCVENGISPVRTTNNNQSMLMEFIATGVNEGLLDEKTVNDIFGVNDETNFILLSMKTAKEFKRSYKLEELDHIEIMITGHDENGNEIADKGNSLSMG